MQINKRLKEIFEEYSINYDEGILYLLAVFFNLKIDEEKFEETIKKVNFAKIVERDYDFVTVKWNISLFDEQNIEDDWEWVVTWRNLFKNIKPDRAGTLNMCLARMKQFFASHPSVRKDDVMEATKMYLSTVNDPNYLTSAHYFIKKDKAANEQSKLQEFLEILKDKKKQTLKNSQEIL